MISTSISTARQAEARHDLLMTTCLIGVVIRSVDRLDIEALDDRQRLAVDLLRETLAEVLEELAGRG